MITVTIIKNSDTYRGFKVEGHAGYAEEGSDIVCSAVSALSINCVNSIEQFTDDSISYGFDDGLIDFSFDETVSKESELLMNSFVLGIQFILEENEEYLKLVFKEE